MPWQEEKRLFLATLKEQYSTTSSHGFYLDNNARDKSRKYIKGEKFLTSIEELYDLFDSSKENSDCEKDFSYLLIAAKETIRINNKALSGAWANFKNKVQPTNSGFTYYSIFSHLCKASLAFVGLLFCLGTAGFCVLGLCVMTPLPPDVFFVSLVFCVFGAALCFGFIKEELYYAYIQSRFLRGAQCKAIEDFIAEFNNPLGSQPQPAQGAYSEVPPPPYAP